MAACVPLTISCMVLRMQRNDLRVDLSADERQIWIGGSGACRTFVVRLRQGRRGQHDGIITVSKMFRNADQPTDKTSQSKERQLGGRVVSRMPAAASVLECADGSGWCVRAPQLAYAPVRRGRLGVGIFALWVRRWPLVKELTCGDCGHNWYVDLPSKQRDAQSLNTGESTG